MTVFYTNSLGDLAKTEHREKLERIDWGFAPCNSGTDPHVLRAAATSVTIVVDIRLDPKAVLHVRHTLERGGEESKQQIIEESDIPRSTLTGPSMTGTTGRCISRATTTPVDAFGPLLELDIDGSENDIDEIVRTGDP